MASLNRDRFDQADRVAPNAAASGRQFIARLLLPTTLAWIGCTTLANPIVPCPLTYTEQEKAVLALVPLGTSRDEALKILAKNGIEGDFGSSHGIYYCDLWRRPTNERWHLDLALMFDESGKLYRTQVAQADVAMLPRDTTDTGTASKNDSLTGTSASLPPGTTLRK